MHSRYRPHVLATLSLGLPLIGSHLARMAIGVGDTVMVGWYGVEPLAALVIATSFFHILFFLGMGFGIGVLGLIDGDVVSLSNLQRQVLFTTADVGRPKAEAAADRLAALNPHVTVTPLARRIVDGDTDVIGAHDLVLDGTDSFAARAAVNAACVRAGGVFRWKGRELRRS